MSTETIERRLREFVAVHEEPDWEDVRRRSGVPRTRRMGRRGAVLVLAVCLAATAAGLAVLLTSSHSRPFPSSWPGPDVFDMTFNRGPGGLKSVHVTVRATTLGGTAELEVVRGRVNAQDVTPDEVVFKERVPMTNISSTRLGPPGTQILSTWSGTLSPSDWRGGCRRGPFEIVVQVVPAVNPTNPHGKYPNGEQIVSGDITCGPG